MNFIQKLYNRFFEKEDTRFYYLSLLKHTEPIQVIDGNKKWSIHGLWPQYSLNKYPSYCENLKFDIKNLESIETELKNKWYSSCEKDSKFWEHEYLKHGSCMFTNMTELEYFEKALELYNYVMENNLADKYYDTESKKCLIPFTLDFKVI